MATYFSKKRELLDYQFCIDKETIKNKIIFSSTNIEEILNDINNANLYDDEKAYFLFIEYKKKLEIDNETLKKIDFVYILISTTTAKIEKDWIELKEYTPMQNSKFIEKLFLKHNINFDTKLNKDRFIKLYSDIKNPFLIENEIIKFSLLDKKIDGLDIEKNSLINTEQTIFKFYKPLLEKDISSVLSIYEELLALKNDPLIIIKILANLLFKFKFYKLLKFNNISDFEICNILNVKTFQLYDYKKFNNVSLEYINHILDELYKTEYNIISSNFDKQQALKLFFLKNVY